MLLKDAKLNRQYIVKNVALEEKVKMRLKNIGLKENEIIIPVKYSIFKTNMLLLLNDNYFSLRKNLLDYIYVQEVK